MKIGLMGCEFESANKGCEALAYSVVEILSHMSCLSGGDTIYNFSGTSLGSIQDKYPTFQYANVAPSLKDLRLKYIRAMQRCDIILDVTMGDSFSDIYSVDLYKWLIRNKRLAIFLCPNYILLPQTYGPFLRESAKKMASGVFEKSDVIYCRDRISQDFLRDNFNIRKSKLAIDMAFFLPYDKNKYSFSESNKKRIGINVSGLLYKGGFSSKNQFEMRMDYKRYIRRLIEHYSDDDNYEIYLVPHVIDCEKGAYDDDYKISKKLKDEFNCLLAPPFEDPISAKSYISNMDVFIGSRMHATIAAFSSGVVTVPVSYSRKFEGVYGDLRYNHVISGRHMNTDDAFNETVNLIRNRSNLKKEMQASQMLINRKKEEFIIDLERIIKKQAAKGEKNGF